MGIDRKLLKSNAKLRLIGKRPNVFAVAVVYLIIINVLSLLYSYMTGIGQAFLNIDLSAYLSIPQMEQFVNDLIPHFTPVAVILTLSILLMTTVIQIGYMSYCLMLSRNLEPKFKNIFDGFAFFLRIIWLSILQGLLIFLWSLLFIIPGIIAAYRYRQSYYIMFDNPEMSALECIRKSKALMRGYKADLFVLDLSFIGWWFLDSIIISFLYIPLLSIWLEPYTGVTYANFYNALNTKVNTSEYTSPGWEIPG